MSEPTRVVPRATLDAPRLVPSVSGLLSLGVDATPDDERWFDGYTYDPRIPIKDARNVSHHTANVGTNQGTGVKAAAINERPWTMRVQDNVSTFQANALNYDAEYRAVLDAYTSKLLERELWTGELATADTNLNRFFTRAAFATTVNGGTALKPQAAVAEIVQAASDGGHVGMVMIHASLRVAIRLPDAWRNPVTMEDYGFVVVAGAGYPGTSPAGAGSNWMYATGQVNYRLGPYDALPMDVRENIYTTKNDIMYRVQRVAAVDFAGPAYVVNTDLT